MARTESPKPAALVTGAAKRIGREIVLHLAKQGYDIALHYHSSQKEAEQTAQEIRKQKVNCEIFSADLEAPTETEKLFSDVFKKFPQLDVLINSASIFEKISIPKSTAADFERHFRINFLAPYLLSQQFALHVRSGNIINFLDTKITTHKSTHSLYLLSKKTLAEFTIMAAREFSPQIRVNAIAPGVISGFPPSKKNESYLDQLGKNNLLERKGSISNITHALQFLLDNNFLTGQIIFVAGGEHIK